FQFNKNNFLLKILSKLKPDEYLVGKEVSYTINFFNSFISFILLGIGFGLISFITLVGFIWFVTQFSGFQLLSDDALHTYDAASTIKINSLNTELRNIRNRLDNQARKNFFANNKKSYEIVGDASTFKLVYTGDTYVEGQINQVFTYRLLYCTEESNCYATEVKDNPSTGIKISESETILDIKLTEIYMEENDDPYAILSFETDQRNFDVLSYPLYTNDTYYNTISSSVFDYLDGEVTYTVEEQGGDVLIIKENSNYLETTVDRYIKFSSSGENTIVDIKYSL
ncbi:hypothetical protein KDA10_03865, partial [candidate division WWE3 bacterium]|nr:hypothetical protein [candidate division WWE3 bacterium]